jgi:hypothetical protein
VNQERAVGGALMGNTEEQLKEWGKTICRRASLKT